MEKKTKNRKRGTGGDPSRCLKKTSPREEEPKEERSPAPGAGERLGGAGKDAQNEMEEFLAPKEVNTGMDVLPDAGFSETAGEVSLASLDGLAA